MGDEAGIAATYFNAGLTFPDLMTTIGVLSDTHIRPNGKRQLPPRVFEAFRGVDLILHAGDLNTLQVVTDLEAIVPVLAVRGNNDDWEAVQRLPATRRIEVEETVLGLAHGDVGPAGYRGAAATTPDVALAQFEFEQDVNCVVFGHSHRSLIEWRLHRGRQVLLFNPGSPTDKRWGPHHSCGLLRVSGRDIRPELLTW